MSNEPCLIRARRGESENQGVKGIFALAALLCVAVVPAATYAAGATTVEGLLEGAKVDIEKVRSVADMLFWVFALGAILALVVAAFQKSAASWARYVSAGLVIAVAVLAWVGENTSEGGYKVLRKKAIEATEEMDALDIWIEDQKGNVDTSELNMEVVDRVRKIHKILPAIYAPDSVISLWMSFSRTGNLALLGPRAAYAAGYSVPAERLQHIQKLIRGVTRQHTRRSHSRIRKLAKETLLEDRFQKANEWATKHGYAGGFPSFHRSRTPEGTVFGTVVIEWPAAEVRIIPAVELGDPKTIDDRYKSSFEWAVKHGYAGGLPNFHQLLQAKAAIYGTILLKKDRAAEVRSIPGAELGDFNSLAGRFRAISDWARKHNYVGGFPNFVDSVGDHGKLYGTVLLTGPSAKWEEVPFYQMR